MLLQDYMSANVNTSLFYNYHKNL